MKEDSFFEELKDWAAERRHGAYGPGVKHIYRRTKSGIPSDELVQTWRDGGPIANSVKVSKQYAAKTLAS